MSEPEIIITKACCPNCDKLQAEKADLQSKYDELKQGLDIIGDLEQQKAELYKRCDELIEANQRLRTFEARSRLESVKAENRAAELERLIGEQHSFFDQIWNMEGNPDIENDHVFAEKVLDIIQKALALTPEAMSTKREAEQNLITLLKGMDLVAMCECHHGDRPKWTCPFCEIKQALEKLNE